MAGPERQCIGCGLRGPQAGFVRLVMERDESGCRVVVAGGGPRTGRSAYLCRRMECLDRAVHRKAFQRAFRAPVVLVQNDIAAAMMVEPRGGPEGQDGR